MFRLAPHLICAALLLGGTTGCYDMWQFPQRTTTDPTHERIRISDTIMHLEVTNRNNVRIGTRFKIRIMRRGDPEVLHEQLEHIYVGPYHSNIATFDLSEYCADAPETCSEYIISPTLLQTYWLDDE
ncbi:MAG: hypothetical protein ACI81R_003677 [Bradymonadia bacterium]|jgi:hypothetical protein